MVLNIAVGVSCFLNRTCHYAAGTEQAAVSVGLQKGSGRISERGVISGPLLVMLRTGENQEPNGNGHSSLWCGIITLGLSS